MVTLRTLKCAIAAIALSIAPIQSAGAQGSFIGCMGKVKVNPSGGSATFHSIAQYPRDSKGKAATVEGYIQNLLGSKAHALLLRTRPTDSASEAAKYVLPRISGLTLDGQLVRFETPATEHLIMLGNKHQPPAFQMDGSLPASICLSEALAKEAESVVFEFRLMEQVRGKLWSVRGPFGLARTSSALAMSALEPSRLKLKLRNDTDSPVTSIRGALVDARGKGCPIVQAHVSDSYVVSVSKDGSFVLSAKAGQTIQIGAKLDLGIEAEGVLSGEYSLRLLPILKR